MERLRMQKNNGTLEGIANFYFYAEIPGIVRARGLFAKASSNLGIFYSKGKGVIELAKTYVVLVMMEVKAKSLKYALAKLEPLTTRKKYRVVKMEYAGASKK